MKKIIFILLCVFAINVNAQEAKTDTTFKKIKEFTFTDIKSFTDGFRLGVHLTPLSGSLSTDGQFLSSSEGSSSVSFGVIFDKYLFDGERYALTTGLSIVNKGGSFTNFNEFRFPEAFPVDSFKANSMDVSLRYLEVPIGLRLRSNPINEKYIVYGNAGFIIGFRGKSRISIAGQEDVDFSKETRFFNFALSYGVGVEYKLGPSSNLMAGIVVSRGRTDFVREIEGVQVNHVGLQIGLFY